MQNISGRKPCAHLPQHIGAVFLTDLACAARCNGEESPVREQDAIRCQLAYIVHIDQQTAVAGQENRQRLQELACACHRHIGGERRTVRQMEGAAPSVGIDIADLFDWYALLRIVNGERDRRAILLKKWRAFERLADTFLRHGLDEIVRRRHVECLDRVLAARRHEDDRAVCIE